MTKSRIRKTAITVQQVRALARFRRGPGQHSPRHDFWKMPDGACITPRMMRILRDAGLVRYDQLADRAPSQSRAQAYLTAAGDRLLPTLPAFCCECGCTDALACPGGCSWVRPDLCSACAVPA